MKFVSVLVFFCYTLIILIIFFSFPFGNAMKFVSVLVIFFVIC